MTNTQKGFAAVYTTVLLLAVNGLFAKGLPISSLDTTFSRSIIASFCLFILLLLFKNQMAKLNCKDWLFLSGLGILLTVHWFSFFEAMRVSTIAIGMTALYTFPVFTVIFEAILERKNIALRDMLLTSIVFLGIYIISPIHQGLGSAFLGVVWGVFSAITFALRNVLQKHYFSHISPILAVAIQCISGAIFFIPFVNSDALFSMELSTILYLLLLGTCFTALPHALLVTSLRYLKAKTISFIACLQPVIGALIALAVLNEVPSFNVIVGGTLILGVAAFETRQVRGQGE